MNKLWACALACVLMGATGCSKGGPNESQETETVAESETVEGINLRYIESNGIRMRIAEQGEGPLVLLVHGWPESWYSWRHQIPALAKAGYRAVAPDIRGYGKTTAPPNIDDYDTVDTSGDMVGILDALGEEQAVSVGHDWGALVAWNSALLHPDRFRGLVAMSVPYGGRGPQPPTAGWKSQFGDNFFYILYFQEPGVAEAEFDADPRGILSRLYTSPDTPREDPAITDPKMSAGGWIGRLGKPKERPGWLRQEALDYYVNEFTEAGFRGGINYYRNFDRNWELTEHLADAKVQPPTLFIAGEKDPVIAGASKEQLQGLMGRVVPDLRDVILYPDAGHWVQQERPEETNEALVAFVKSLD